MICYFVCLFVLLNYPFATVCWFCYAETFRSQLRSLPCSILSTSTRTNIRADGASPVVECGVELNMRRKLRRSHSLTWLIPNLESSVVHPFPLLKHCLVVNTKFVTKILKCFTDKLQSIVWSYFTTKIHLILNLTILIASLDNSSQLRGVRYIESWKSTCYPATLS